MIEVITTTLLEYTEIMIMFYVTRKWRWTHLCNSNYNSTEKETMRKFFFVLFALLIEITDTTSHSMRAKVFSRKSMKTSNMYLKGSSIP